MAKPSIPPVEVICPRCQTRLKVDPQLGVVLSHERPPAPVHDVDISNAAGILAGEEQRREDKSAIRGWRRRTKKTCWLESLKKPWKKAAGAAGRRSLYAIFDL